MMQSDHSSALSDYYSHLLQQPPPLQPLTSSNLSSYPLTQQPNLQHTMSVADPFSPSWPLFNPPSPARKQSGAFNGGSTNWLENAQQLMPAVSSAGLQLNGVNIPAHLLPHLSQLNTMQRPTAVQSMPQQQQTALYQPMAQRASNMAQQQQQAAMNSTITPQLLNQLNQFRAQQQQQALGVQRMQSLTGMPPPMQPFAATTQPNMQSFRSPASNGSSNSQPTAVQQPVVPLQPAANNTVELATSLLSYLSSKDLQRGLLFVNRLWRFKSLYVLQSRQVNIQVQLTHLYLGPFRAANMLELVFSLQVQQRLTASNTTSSNNVPSTPVQTLRPLQVSSTVPMSPASVPRTPVKASVPSPSLTSPSTVARATVCTPMGSMSAVVKAKELSKADGLLNSPSMVLSGGKHLSKKKMREAALLAESKYNSIIECGILPNESNGLPTSHPPQRTFKLFSPFFGKQVEVYTALSDTTQETLYRASSLAEKFDYATNKVGMYLSRRRLHSGGIFQATGFRSKPAGRTGLKCGGYFLTIEACKEFENHFQYGGMTEEQRKEKATGELSAPTATASSGTVEMSDETDGNCDDDAGDLGDGEESDVDEAEVVEQHHSADKVKIEDKPHPAIHGRPLSAVTKKLVDTSFGHSMPAASVGTNSRKRSADDSPSSGDMSSSPSSSFKRVRSDEGGMSTTDSGSGSDSAGGVSSTSVGKQTSSSSDEDGNSSDRSPATSSRTTAFHSGSHSHLHSSSASTTSSASVGSQSSHHRSAFKAPTPMRASSFQGSSVASTGSHNNTGSTSPTLSGRDISPSTSPGSVQVPTLPASASFLPSISSSSGSPSYQSSAFPSLSRWQSYGAPMMSPIGSQSILSSPTVPTSYVQLSSPPMGVSHQFNGLSIAGAAGSPSSSMALSAPVVPLSMTSPGQSLEAAFASALMQGSHSGGGMGVAGPSASVGANGLVNLNNLTMQQLQQLLSGQLSGSNQFAQSLNGALNQQPSLLNYAGLQQQVAQQQQQQTQLQPVMFG